LKIIKVKAKQYSKSKYLIIYQSFISSLSLLYEIQFQRLKLK